MARIRTIHPSLPHEKALREVSAQAKILGYLLPLICDDSGRSRIDFLAMTEQLMPYVEDAAFKIPVWFEELESSGWVNRYQIDGVGYLRMPYWKEHQRVEKPTRSRLPGEPRQRGASATHEGQGAEPTPWDAAFAPREDGFPEPFPEERASLPMATASEAIPPGAFFVEGAGLPEERAEVPMPSAPEAVPPGTVITPDAGAGPMPTFTPQRVLALLEQGLQQSLRDGGHTAAVRYIELAGRAVNLWGGRGAPMGRPASSQAAAPAGASAQETSLSPDQILRGVRSGN